MDLKKIVTEEIGNVINGALNPAGAGKGAKKATGKDSGVTKAVDDIVNSKNKVDGIKKAATDLIDKNDDGNIVDDLIGDVSSMFDRKK